MVLPIILSGGAGSRLWPLSRELHPKQFLPLVGNQTMLQCTVSRLQGLVDVQPPVIVCNEAHRFIVAEQLRSPDIGPATIILEPCGRNTAPAVAIAALYALDQGTDPLLLVLPADHLIQDVEGFHRAIEAAVQIADQGKLVTFGVVANSPETGYGYIKANKKSPYPGPCGECKGFAVDEFVEKPNLDTAQKYIQSGEYYWNSGMFLFRASRFIEELQRFEPEMLEYCRLSLVETTKDVDFLRLGQEPFCACPAESIDYAVMEKTENAVVVPLQAGWSDIGSWSALWEVQDKDCNGNVLIGDVLAHDTAGSYLHATNRLVATLGVEDLIIVETADAVLVANKDHVQDVKGIVDHLKQHKRDETLLHRWVSRPWGSYERIDSGERFQVKRITVNPGACLSLQKHYHRAEHWVVVKGTAQITCGDKVLLLAENQSTYIPPGEIHRLENPGRIILEMIEVQSGSYLGEDDIVRYEDNYGR